MARFTPGWNTISTPLLRIQSFLVQVRMQLYMLCRLPGLNTVCSRPRFGPSGSFISLFPLLFKHVSLTLNSRLL